MAQIIKSFHLKTRISPKLFILLRFSLTRGNVLFNIPVKAAAQGYDGHQITIELFVFTGFRGIHMDVQVRLWKGRTVSFFMMSLMAGLLAFPPSAYAIEVGCFCTFVFVSAMFVVGIGVTLVVKYTLSKKIWELSLKRTLLITFIEVVLLTGVLIILQTKFYLRVLAYLPLAFLLNYAMIKAGGLVQQERQASKKRAAMAVLSCLVLPVAVQIMGWLATVLSNMITFTEVRV